MVLDPTALEHARQVGRNATPPTPAEGAQMRAIWVAAPPAEQARAS